MLHHKPPEILMDMQIKHLVSGSSFAMSILMSLAPQIDWILGFTPDGQSKFPHPWPPQIPPGSAFRL
jgi:hypothetical protein